MAELSPAAQAALSAGAAAYFTSYEDFAFEKGLAGGLKAVADNAPHRYIAGRRWISHADLIAIVNELNSTQPTSEED